MVEAVSKVSKKKALIVAGGTGGHIFPGLAVAHELAAKGWAVHWLGTPNSMEQRVLAQEAYPFEAIQFAGVRGKGLRRWLALPWHLFKACWQVRSVMRRVKPDVVVGFGGYLTVPAGLVARLLGKPLVLHEQNAIAGMANRALAKVAQRVFTAFPTVLPNGEWVGNPLRAAFTQQAAPAERFNNRSGTLQVLVVGGSLGAKALNDAVPQAVALIPPERRPQVVHQSGEKQLPDLQRNYAAAGVAAECTAFITDTASAFAKADLVIARAGASTVTEIAAVGAAAYFVPFPYAVDDHQTANAKFLRGSPSDMETTHQPGAWLVQQGDLSAEGLAQFLQSVTREQLLAVAQAAYSKSQTQAAQQVWAACETLVTQEC